MAINKKQLKQAQKRRARRPEPTIAIAPSMEVKASERNRLTKPKASVARRLVNASKGNYPSRPLM